MTMAAGANLDQIALRDTNQTTGRRWIHNATESISLFVSGAKAKIADTFKIIAAKGNIQMQAQDGEIAATAQKDVTITSVNGKVIIQAPQEILLAAGGGYIRIGANIEMHNPGKQSQKAAGFSLSGPESMPPALPELPAVSGQPFNKKFVMTGFDHKPTEGALIKLFDPEKKEVVWQSNLAADGSSDPLPEKQSLDRYTAVAGFKESSFFFYDEHTTEGEDPRAEKFEDDHGDQ